MKETTMIREVETRRAKEVRIPITDLVTAVEDSLFEDCRNEDFMSDDFMFEDCTNDDCTSEYFTCEDSTSEYGTCEYCRCVDSMSAEDSAKYLLNLFLLYFNGSRVYDEENNAYYYLIGPVSCD